MRLFIILLVLNISEYLMFLLLNYLFFCWIENMFKFL